MFNLLERDLLQIIDCVKNKKVVVYGADICVRDVIQKLQCLDIEVSYCVDDKLDDVQVSLEVKDVFSLFLEKDDFYVLIAKENREDCAKILEGIGLKFYTDFNSINRAGFLMRFNESPLDVNLGYGMQMEKHGIKIYGNKEKAKNVIAILGGSTSDPCHYPWKSWGECLWELTKEEYAVVVGAVAGYDSSQEVIKLLRDIIPLKPDLIISYSGVNDTMYNQSYINNYQKYLFNVLEQLKPGDKWGICKKDGRVCYGVKNEITYAERWVSSQRIMHAIAGEFGISYKAFFQPTLYTKRRGIRDEELYYYSDSLDMKKRIKYTQQVRELIKENKFDYIEDATGWLDDYDGLFFDFAHVKEQGNRYIAEKVYRYIFGRREEE